MERNTDERMMGDKKMVSFKLRALLVILVLVCILILPGRAFSHRVNIYAWVEGNRVFTESYSSDGKLLKNAGIKIYTSDKSLLLEGKTNNLGEFSFEVDRPQDLLIVLDLGDGHRAEYKISKNDFSGFESSLNAVPESTSAGNKSSGRGMGEKGSISGSSSPEKSQYTEALNQNEGLLQATSIDEQALRKIVRDEIQKELRGVYQALGRIEQKRTSVSDVLGGIGYIVGLFGLYMAFKKGRRHDRKK